MRVSSGSTYRTASASRASRTSAPIAGRVSDGRRWVSTVAVRTGFTARPRARRLRGPPPAPPRLGQPNERLEVALGARQPGAGVAHHGRPQPAGGRAHGHQRPPPRRGVPHDPALADLAPPDLELGLDQGQAVEPLGRAAEHGRQDLGQRDERDVDHDQVRRVGQLVGTQRARVAPFDDRHPRIGAEPPGKLAVGDIHRDDVRNPGLEQAVGEPARRGADVERPPPRHRNGERVQGVSQLDAPARDERRRRHDLELDVVGHELAGFLGPPAVGQQ